MADTNITNSTNSTTTTCSDVGDKWWVFLVTTVVIYLTFFITFSIVYGVYWLLVVKYKLSCGRKSPAGKKFFSYIRTLRKFMRRLKIGETILGKILITVTLICNLAFIVLAINRSFPDHNLEECVDAHVPELTLELILVCELLVFSLVRFLACDNVLLYWLDLYTIVDVCTLPHIFIAIALGVDWIGLRSLRFIWLTQIATVFQFTPLVTSQNVIDVINLVLYFLALWLTSSGILHLIEAQGDFWKGNSGRTVHTLLTYVYLNMVTMSTVGYGDFSPDTDAGRAFTVLFIFAGLAFFAAVLPKLVEIVTDYHAKTQYVGFDMTHIHRHVIVCGHITAVTAKDFLKDFLHPDRGDKQTHVLFLHPEKPDKELRNVLRTYYKRVQYLLGSVLHGQDLLRANLHTSTAIFILANKYTNNPNEEDNANLLRVISVKNTTQKIPIIVQLLHSFSKIQVSNIYGWSNGRDIAVCLNELKLGLLAQSCLCPGFSTLIANLFYAADFPKDIGRNEKWKEYYFDGASNEVYSKPFSEAFDGKTFHEAAQICFSKFNLILFALEHIELDQHYYYVNPSLKFHHMLKIKPDAMLGYFIAQDQRHVSAVSTYCECCKGNKHISPKNKDNRNILERELSTLRRNVTLNKFKRRLHFQENAVVADPSINGDVMSSTSNFPMPSPCRSQEEVETIEVVVRNESLLNLPITALRQRIRMERPSLDEKSSMTSDGDDEKEFHICEPVQMEERILNPDMLKAHDSVFQPDADIRDHVIVCLFADRNSPLLGLHSFLKPLRHRRIPQDSVKPVVIICEREFIEREWLMICNVPKVYLVVGSPLLWSNLEAAKVMDCSVCVLLTVLPTSTCHDHAINDKEVVLCSLSIKEKLKKTEKKVLIITDLRHEANVQFLDFEDEDTPDGRIYKAQPFACGEAFSASVFDSVTSAAFHGPGILYLLEDLIHSSGTKTQCQVVSKPIRETNYVNKTFGEFYSQQLRESNICLGVFRVLFSCRNVSYVITSPKSDLVLDADDVIFILTE